MREAGLDPAQAEPALVEGAVEETPEQLRSVLSELEARGARGYDAPACDCVHALLARADELGGGIAARLRQRALAHLSGLRARFDRDATRVAASLHAYEAQGGEQIELRKLVSAGDLTRAARRVRRLRAAPGSMRPMTLTQAPEARFKRAGLSAVRKKRVTIYEDSVAQMVATFALARATDVVPAGAGPYNPLRIASDVLERMRTISPFYLAMQLNRLEELASLLSLPELPESEHAKARLLEQAAADKKRKKNRLKR